MATGTSTPIFESFIEYWYYTKNLSETQRDIIYTSLPFDQRKKLEKSYERGGWHDVFMRNELNVYVDELKKESGYDLVDIRCKVLSNKSVYLPRDFWEKVISFLDGYGSSHNNYLIGGIRPIVCRGNQRTVLLIREDSDSGGII